MANAVIKKMYCCGVCMAKNKGNRLSVKMIVSAAATAVSRPL
jgi:hypothetical protein